MPGYCYKDICVPIFFISKDAEIFLLCGNNVYYAIICHPIFENYRVEG
jgi:hypothetical protein